MYLGGPRIEKNESTLIMGYPPEVSLRQCKNMHLNLLITNLKLQTPLYFCNEMIRKVRKVTLEVCTSWLLLKPVLNFDDICLDISAFFILVILIMDCPWLP